MAAQRTSFEKLQRDRAKKAKQQLKRERRQSGEPRNPGEESDEVVISAEGELTAAELLAQIELIHKQLADEEIDFEEFEERKLDLMARLPID